MKVMVALEDRFFKTQNGSIYSNTTCDYNFWSRYLQVFDEVVVLARVCELDQEQLDKPKANGHGVTFCELPYYVGPREFLKAYRKLNAAIKQNIEMANAYILRAPGTINTLLWYHLRKLGKPYGVEVIGDSLDSLKAVEGNKLLRGVLSCIAPRNQKQQCQNAVAAAYVSEFYLQQKYPPGCWSTHYSTLDLPEEALIKDRELEQKIISLRDVAARKRPLRICHAGTMEVAYKAQDILLEAASISLAKGVQIELNLLGEGRFSKYYKSKAVGLGIEKYVNFIGMLPAGEAVRKQLDAADIFILPSITEGLPRILIEAMARGLPCIATSVGGIPELLDKEDMVVPNDSHKLAEKIITVTSDFRRMSDMACRNLNKARKYNFKELNTRRLEFYQRLADETIKFTTRGPK